MNAQAQVSPRGAVARGLLCDSLDDLIILLALGIVPHARSPRDTPPWVVVSAGLAFVLAGASIIAGEAVAGGVGPGGDLPQGTPFGTQLVQDSRALGSVGLPTAIAFWVAFGPGPKPFKVTGIPFLESAKRGGDRVGRLRGRGPVTGCHAPRRG